MMGPVVLLVDDERSLRALVSGILSQGGFQVVEAADGTDALSIIKCMQGAVDVLVTDIRMPRLGGIELVRSVKIDFPDIPVVYISGEEAHEELHNPHARQLFLLKPFQPEALLDAVRSAMAAASAPRG